VTVLTAYDYPTAKIFDSTEVDIIFVGDSVGTAELGFSSTIPVTLNMMVHHVQAVRRGVSRALLLADMPFLSFQVDENEALRNAGRLIQEGGADAVKLEGGSEVAGVTRRLTSNGIPVVAHIGLQPQHAKVTGIRVQGRTEEAAERMLLDAKAQEEAGAFAIVLELVPRKLAGEISRSIAIPTIGIGSGAECDGQVLVGADMLGLIPGAPSYRHVKRYANLAEIIAAAAGEFVADVQSGVFPADENSFE